MTEPACDIYQAVFEVADNVSFLEGIREIADEHQTHITFFDATAWRGATTWRWRSGTPGAPGPLAIR